MAMLSSIMDSWKDSYTVRRVFGDAVEKDGITVIPVAKISGGGGGGMGQSSDEDPSSEGEGGGFAGMARPVGVYVVRAESVEWHPALDITMLGVAGMVLAALITLVLGRSLRRR
jgi:uncharacterized spore protein YtfJ